LGSEFLPMTRQIERLRPYKIESALSERSLIYLPLGTIEWHCYHLPVGLDALTAHGLCLQAAAKQGGLVWPALYYGTGGGHGAFPWTVMMPEATEIEALINFTGHFADTQLEMIARIATNWNAKSKLPHVISLSVNQAPVPGFLPDHAGLFETTLLDGVDPGMSDLALLGSDRDEPDRFDPVSPLWGIVGADPRQSAPIPASDLVEKIANWLSSFSKA
jgi:creatinine amidohydrolase